jgi:hypothetical protein
MDSLLVPSSIQRIRSFLVEMCGMKVAPWASTEETLAALHTTLVARQGCGIFWDSLRTLLERLARDMKTRAAAQPGTVIDNELLDGERYASLLDEIRQSLDRQAAAATKGSFRQLSAALSGPALSLLLLLGGVASVGCESSGLKQRNEKPDAALAANTKPDTQPFPEGGSPGEDARKLILISFDVAPPNPPVTLTPPDARFNHDGLRATDGGMVTIHDIMDSCNVDVALQDLVLRCLSVMRDSWTTGVAETLAKVDCREVEYQLSCFRSGSTSKCGEQSEFVVGATRICKPVYIYAGVRFV